MDPKKSDWLLSYLAAALSFSLSWKLTRIPEWFSFFLLLVAVVFLSSGFLNMINWQRHENARRVKAMSLAKTAGQTAMGHAFKGLPYKAIDMIARHDATEIRAILGNNDEFVWVISAPGGDIPWLFMAEFLERSLETFPYLFPVRNHHEFDWPNSEELCTIATNFIKWKGWAKPAVGNRAAELTTSLEVVAAKLRIEL